MNADTYVVVVYGAVSFSLLFFCDFWFLSFFVDSFCVFLKNELKTGYGG
jgi:hypothetical protein